LAVTLSVWARRNFQNDQFSICEEPKDGHLLSTGPYHFIRHPMYTSALLLIWAGILGHVSPLNLFVGAVVTGLIAIRIVVEEQYLRTSYPDYAEYSQSTKRVIPLII
jgi:protein-S-isoprenylcysteine O-methyltransferase Ste14